MKKTVRIKGALKSYLRWPLLLIPLIVCMNISILLVDKKAGILMGGYTLLYILIALILYFAKRGKILKDIVGYAADYGKVQKQLLRDGASVRGYGHRRASLVGK